ncbi:MAG: aldehyde dehydrogenase family protein [Nitrospirota bacterium]|nr:aldehyde dehydrogenase family protein [Nitrospirota bacterium]
MVNLKNPAPFLIGREWRQSSIRQPVVNPYTGESIVTVCQATDTDLEDAISLSTTAASQLAKLASHQRAQGLLHVASALIQRQDELAQTISLESGKPLTDARREVQRAINTFTIASEEAKRLPGDVIPMDTSAGMDHYQAIVQRVPIGPVLAITPFNFPLNLVAHKVAPCLAVGNPVVLKPAPQTPMTALLLGEILLGADLPPGTISIVPCDNSQAEEMVKDPRFKAVSFTGSVNVGWMIKAKAGKKRVVLELGGNAAVIVERDADLEFASHRCATGGFSYSGQTCISVQRVFIQDAVYDRFVDLLLNRVRGLSCGDPMDENTVVGPLINKAAATRVEAWIHEALSQGATLLTGGTRQGTIVAPTVLAKVRSDMNVSCQEIFGPVITLSRYHDFDEALDMVNDSAFGLQAGVFTKDINKIFQTYRELEVGTVLANEVPTFRADHMPYGGVKDSGVGREGVRYAMEDLTEPKLLVLHLPR